MIDATIPGRDLFEIPDPEPGGLSAATVSPRAAVRLEPIPVPPGG